MEEHDCSALPSLRVSFPGPFEHHDVVVDGWRVPFLQAHVADEDQLMLVLDRRLAVTLSAAEAERVVPFIADAIAIALGYSAHPEGDEPRPWRPYPRPERIIDVELLPGA